MAVKRLWETFGKSLAIEKKEFYRKVKVINNLNGKIDWTILEKEFPETYREIMSSGLFCRLSAEVRLEAIGELLKIVEIERIDWKETITGWYLDYLNVGDPYKPTIVYCRSWRRGPRIALNGWAQYVK